MRICKFPPARYANLRLILSEWVANYKAKRPGVEVLQGQIDQWMVDYDARELQVRFQALSIFTAQIE